MVRLGVRAALRDTLATTNPIESALSVTRRVTARVTRWHDGDMQQWWCAAGLLRAEEKFRRVKGHPRCQPFSRVWSLSSSGNRLEASVTWRKNVHRNRQLFSTMAGTISSRPRSERKGNGTETNLHRHWWQHRPRIPVLPFSRGQPRESGGDRLSGQVERRIGGRELAPDWLPRQGSPPGPGFPRLRATFRGGVSTSGSSSISGYRLQCGIAEHRSTDENDGRLRAWFKTPGIRVTVLALLTGVGSCSGFSQPRSGGIS